MSKLSTRPKIAFIRSSRTWTRRRFDSQKLFFSLKQRDLEAAQASIKIHEQTHRDEKALLQQQIKDFEKRHGFVRELLTLVSSVKELNQQKEWLHSHLDVITSQALRVQSQVTQQGEDSSLAHIPPDKAIKELQAVVFQRLTF